MDITTSNKDLRKSADMIVQLAEIYDSKGLRDQPIRVNLSRSHLMKLGFKPHPRGGKLYYQQHELICKEPVKKTKKQHQAA